MGQISQDGYCAENWSLLLQLWALFTRVFILVISKTQIFPYVQLPLESEYGNSFGNPTLGGLGGALTLGPLKNILETLADYGWI